MVTESPNSNIRPSSTAVNELGHLVIGGADTVDLAQRFGTPLWIMDEQTMVLAATAYKDGLRDYPDAQVLYAGKAFLCLAMIHFLRQQGLGLDVVSEGELFTAKQAKFPADLIFMHGNNKSEKEVREGLEYGDVKVVVDSLSELHMVASIAKQLNRSAKVLVRIIPGVEPDTHHHIVTGHHDSKFGIALDELTSFAEKAIALAPDIDLLGLHAHIGSQAHEVEPYFENIDILADSFLQIKEKTAKELTHLDVGGGLGIAYTNADRTTPISTWTRGVADRVQTAFGSRNLKLPKLFIEPGRSIVGPAGVTLYRTGHQKTLPTGTTYLSVDGGMADNPRPITYDAKYTAVNASRMNAPLSKTPRTLAGKYCESGDIIIKETHITADSGDVIAVFGTGAYNYSMASNYNRTGRPACVLVSNGIAEVIIERESNEDLLRHDRVPDRLLR